jgi:hypothetical protein
MTNPPGMVVDAYPTSVIANPQGIQIYLWNYTDYPIEVGLQWVSVVPGSQPSGTVGTFPVPPNSTPETAGTDSATPVVYPAVPLTPGGYNITVELLEGGSYTVATDVIVPEPIVVSPGGGTPSFPAGHHSVWAHNLPVGEPIAGEPLKPGL